MQLAFEGTSADSVETILTVVDPTSSDKTITLPNLTGHVNLFDATSTTLITSTPAEINLIDGGTSRGTTAVASGDGLLVNDGGVMRMTNVDTVSTYFSSHNVGGGAIVTTGALDSGSITSNFGSINVGSSAITTTGTVTAGDLNVTGTTTTVSTANLAVEDNLMSIAAEQTTGTNTDAVDVGFYSPYRVSGGTRYRGLFYDLSTTRWKFFNRSGNSDEAPGTGNVVNTTSGFALGNLEAGDITGTLRTVAQPYITSVGTLSGLVIANAGNIGSASDTDAIAISSGGVVTMNQIPVFSAGINVSGGTIAGTLATASQTAITGVGTITTGVWNAGAVTSSGVVTATGFTIGSAAITEAELEILDGATLDTTEINYLDRGATAIGLSLASKAVVLDSNGDFEFQDSDVLAFGNSGDLKIYHDGSNSFINDQGTGQIVVVTSAFNVNNAANNASMITMAEGGAASLYYNGSAKLATHNTGVEITGSLEVATIDYTDGDLAMTIANGGGVTFDDVVDFDGNVTITGASPRTLTIGANGNGDNKIVLDANDATWYIGTFHDRNDEFQIGLGSAVGTAERLTMQAAKTVINNDGADIDFAVDGVSANDVFLVDASTKKVGINAGTAPKGDLHIRGQSTNAANDGQAFGSKDIVLTDAYDSTAQLAITMSNYQACYVKVFITGNWATGTHYAVAYLGEFFVQRTNNAGNEPGAIIRQIDNTHSGSMSAQIVDVDGSAGWSLYNTI